MGFYDLTKPERQKIVKKIEDEIQKAILDLDFKLDNNDKKFIPVTILNYTSDSDTYIRKMLTCQLQEHIILIQI